MSQNFNKIIFGTNSTNENSVNQFFDEDSVLHSEDIPHEKLFQEKESGVLEQHEQIDISEAQELFNDFPQINLSRESDQIINTYEKDQNILIEAKPQNLINQEKKNIQRQNNKNIPKNLLLALFYFHKKFKDNIFKNYEKQFSNNCLELQTIKLLNDIASLGTLSKFLKYDCGDEESKKQSTLRRLMLRIIIQRHSRRRIIDNNHVKNKQLYLVSQKIFGLRAMNSHLIKRNEIQ